MNIKLLRPLRLVFVCFLMAYSIPSLFAGTGYVTNGLVAYWKLNDGAGSTASDSSGNGNNLPLLGSPTWGSNIVNFNGSTQYGDGNNQAYNNLDQHELTICAWIYKLSSSQKGIVNKYGNGGWSFQVTPNNRLDFFVDPHTPDLTDVGTASIPLGQWTFVAMTWAQPNNGLNTVAYYINGIINSAEGTSGANESPSGGADLQLGNVFTGPTYAFDGSMHDVAIYNRVLTPAEIQTNFLNTEFTTNVNVPDILYYEMTEYPKQQRSGLFCRQLGLTVATLERNISSAEYTG